MVVDNGSVDDSIALMERDLPGVHVIRLAENVGVAKANDIGVERAMGARVALLNNDTVVDPDWLAELGVCLAVLNALPHVCRERRRVQSNAVVSWTCLQGFIDDTRSVLHRV